MHPAEYVFLGALKRGLREVISDPRLIADCYASFACDDLVREVVGDGFVQSVTSMVAGSDSRRLEVKLAYMVQPKDNYGLYVHGSRQPEREFLGKYGSTSYEPPEHERVLIGNVTLSGLGRNGCYGIAGEPPCWFGPGALVRVGNEYHAVERVFRAADGYRAELGSVGKLSGPYAVYSEPPGSNVERSVNVDTVSLSADLFTVGDCELHYVLALLVRYVIKRMIPVIEFHHIQVATVSQSEMRSFSMDGEVGFATSFNLSGKSAESWISSVAGRPAYAEVCLTPTR